MVWQTLKAFPKGIFPASLPLLRTSEPRPYDLVVACHAIKKSLTSIAESVIMSEIVWRSLWAHPMLAISDRHARRSKPNKGGNYES